VDNQSDPGVRPAPRERAAGEVDVPIWALHAEVRATLLRIVRAGGRVPRSGPARDHVAALLRDGYLAPYDEGTVIVTPAALRAITAEAERRAASQAETDEDEGRGADASGGDAAEAPRARPRHPPLSS
jgi:hypothetical protein